MGVAPAEIARVLAPIKQAMDMSTSTIDQAAVAIHLEGVDWERRPSELRAVYATLMPAMVDRLAEVLSAPHGSVLTPQGRDHRAGAAGGRLVHQRTVGARGAARHVLHARVGLRRGRRR